MATPRSKDPMTNLPCGKRVSGEQHIGRGFFEKVFMAMPSGYESDLQTLCSAWLEATRADWVWLWLKHEGDGAESLWELTAAVGIHGYTSDLVPAEPANVALEEKRSVAEFCSLFGKPVFIDDIVNWERHLEHQPELTYKVVCQDELLKRNCRSFLAVPLAFPDINPSQPLSVPHSQTQKLKGLICCHFTTQTPERILRVLNDDSYASMARASTQAILTSFSVAQHQILFSLDKLTSQYLSSHSGNISVKRHDFLTKVINLVKEHLRVQFASVFYRTNDGERIICLATTGLRSLDGPLSPTRLHEARYSKHENITGTVFATGEPFVSQIGQTPSIPGRTTYKWRETPEDVPERMLPWVCYPIMTPDDKTVLGVLRCVGNRTLLAKSFPRNFDPFQLKTLDFITRQLAPVLETLASYINRERTISIIKHDLFAPLKMIEDSISKATSQLALGRPPSDYFVSDLQCCIQTAKSLAQGLDQSPTELKEFDPRPTWMEADIVAVIQNMLRHYARLYNSMDIRFNDASDRNRGHISDGFPKKLWLDRNLIARALSNLIINAVKYGEEKTTIYVSARRVDGRGFYLDIENQGIGILGNEANRIFEEGYRSPRAEERAIGVGMGLAIARAIMEKHKGRLDLVSPANPTVFSMFFPAHLVRT